MKCLHCYKKLYSSFGIWDFSVKASIWFYNHQYDMSFDIWGHFVYNLIEIGKQLSSLEAR